MNEKGTRIEISPELHEIIKAVYNERKSKGDKEITQKKILEELCRAGLEKNESNNESSGKAIHTPTFSGAPSVFFPSGSYVLETKSQQKKMQEALYAKEEQLLKREKQLMEREEIVNNKFLKYLNEKEKSLGYEKSPKDMDLMFMKFFESRINDKNDQIHELKVMIRDLKSDLRKSDNEIQQLLRKVERNTRKDVLKDEILPILTPLLVGIDIYQGNKQKSDTENQKNVEQFKEFLNLTPDQKTKMLNNLKNSTNTPQSSNKKPPSIKKDGQNDKE